MFKVIFSLIVFRVYGILESESESSTALESALSLMLTEEGELRTSIFSAFSMVMSISVTGTSTSDETSTLM